MKLGVALKIDEYLGGKKLHNQGEQVKKKVSKFK